MNAEKEHNEKDETSRRFPRTLHDNIIQYSY